MKKYINLICIILLLLLTVSLRMYRWEDKFSFNAEYNYKLWPMQRLITEKKLTLIGIEAVSYLHHIHYPPLFLYLFAPILALSNFNPASVEVSLILVSMVTAYIFFQLGKEYRDRNFGYLLVFLYAVSFLAQRSDRFIWVVGPIIGITAFFLLVLLRSFGRGEIDKKVGFLLGCLIGVGLNFHYQIMVLPIALAGMMIYSGFRKMVSWQSIAFLIVGISIFLSPLLFFDLRHDFYNLVGIRLLLAYSSGGFALSRQIISAAQAFSSMFLGMFIPPNNPAVLVSENILLALIITILVNGFFAFTIFSEENKKRKLILQFSHMVGVVGFIIFMLIRNNFNYYLFILQSVFLLLLGILLSPNPQKKQFSFFSASLLIAFIAINITKTMTFTSYPSWKQQKQAFNFMLETNRRNPLSISFEQSASEEYLFLLYYLALKHNINFSKIEYYEPWQDGSKAEFVFNPKVLDEQKIHLFGPITILQRTNYD